jgi:cytochrome bd-type quinol oxidase subunit 1
MPFHLSHFREVLNQFWLFGLTLLFHMVFDDLSIAEGSDGD